MRSQLNELMEKVETSKKDAFGELAKRKQLESEIAEAFNKVSMRMLHTNYIYGHHLFFLFLVTCEKT